MTGKVKEALISTAIVLGTIWALRQFAMTRNVVDRALAG